jgi:hypothetical protein
VRVRELRARWGTEERPFAALGRLRWAAQTVGMLDGARVAAPLGKSFVLAAYGGLVPDPIDGSPASGSTRFGVEGSWTPQKVAWQPRLDVSAQGSFFNGSIDERRLSTIVRLFPGRTVIAAYAEISAFYSWNTWGLNPIELTASGVDVAWRNERFRAGVRLDARQPERSLWLESLLPASWLPATRDLRVMAAANGGVTVGKVAFDAGGAAIGEEGASGGQWNAWSDLRFTLPAGFRADAGVTASDTSFVDLTAVRLGGGVTRGRVDLGAWYRGGLLTYTAANESLFEHRVGADLTFSASRPLDLSLSVEGATGADVDAVAILATAVWRPLP